MAHRVLHYSPMTAGKIVNACAIVHNICNEARIPYCPLSEEEMRLEAQRQCIVNGVPPNTNLRRYCELAEGRAQRDALVTRLWYEQRRH